MFAAAVYLKSLLPVLLLLLLLLAGSGGVAAKSQFPLETGGIIKIFCSDASANGVCQRNGDVGQLTALPNNEILIKYGQGIICQCGTNDPATLVTCDGSCTCKKCATDENDCSDPCAAATVGWFLSVVTATVTLAAMWL
eukprot:scaffold6238_cov106-Cylindrotheca_fusiformis.AAC.4